MRKNYLSIFLPFPYLNVCQILHASASQENIVLLKPLLLNQGSTFFSLLDKWKDGRRDEKIE